VFSEHIIIAKKFFFAVIFDFMACGGDTGESAVSEVHTNFTMESILTVATCSY